MALHHARCHTRKMAAKDKARKPGNRSTTPISEAFRGFIQSGWDEKPTSPQTLFEQSGLAATRRKTISQHFPGRALVIPAGLPQQRSNDTDYPFRPHTAFSYLTGWGARAVPGSILCGIPVGDGHQWKLFVRPPAPRTSDEFYADSALGEFWTGPRPSLNDVSVWLGLDTADLATWPEVTADLGSWVTIPEENSPALPDSGDLASESDNQRLARVISEARLVKDEWEIKELREAISSTHRGFNDILQSLPDAIGNPRGERVVEGIFHTRARLEGNDTGYGTIAASGPHACILHWVDNDGPVKPGDLLLVDAGVERDSLYTADITRTIPVSGLFSPLQREVYDAVLAAADHAFSVVKPGAIFRDIHQAAMEIIAARVSSWGFLPVSLEESLKKEGQHHRRYMIHGTSHHLGLDVHDCAEARREMYMEKELEPGMVFTIEPGLYFQPDDTTVPPEWRGIGVRIEDNILVTSTGAENLSAAIPRVADDVENWVRLARSPVD